MGTILEDKREIEIIAWNNEVDASYPSNMGYKINAYPEPGMHCNIPFFAVEKDGMIVARVPAWQVSVHYKVPK